MCKSSPSPGQKSLDTSTTRDPLLCNFVYILFPPISAASFLRRLCNLCTYSMALGTLWRPRTLGTGTATDADGEGA